MSTEVLPPLQLTDEELDELQLKYPKVKRHLLPHLFNADRQPVGKPGPKPGSKNLKSVLKRVLKSKINLKNPLTFENQELSVTEALALTLVAKALDGNMRAIMTIYDRIDGTAEAESKIAAIEAQSSLENQQHEYDWSKLSAEELANMKSVFAKVVDPIEPYSDEQLSESVVLDEEED